MKDDSGHEEEALPVILRASGDYPDLEAALDWLTERRVRCRIDEPSTFSWPLMALFKRPIHPVYRLEVVDPRDFDRASKLLGQFDRAAEAEAEAEKRTKKRRSVLTTATTQRTSPLVSLSIVVVIVAVFVFVARN